VSPPCFTMQFLVTMTKIRMVNQEREVLRAIGRAPLRTVRAAALAEIYAHPGPELAILMRRGVVHRLTHGIYCAVQTGGRVSAPVIGDCDGLADLVLERYDEALRGDIRMNCDTCVYRIAMPGFEHKVGQAQTPHDHPDDPADPHAHGHGHGHTHGHGHAHR